MPAVHDPQTLSNWLSVLDLQAYEPLFVSNDISFELLHEVTADDLRDMGISSVGHRRILLLAIAKLKETSEQPSALEVPAQEIADEKPSRDKYQATANHQHRLLTVMFCDLVGSTELSAQLDTEDLQRLLQAYRMCLREVVQKHKGYIAQYLGDGVLVYFGYPETQESDCERALRAALDTVTAVQDLPLVAGVKLQVRVGLERIWDAVIAAAAFYALWLLIHFVHTEVGWGEAGRVFVLGLYTLMRVIVLIVLAAVIWIPIGVWVGMRPNLSSKVQAIAQFLAAIPANLMFPVAVVLIVRFGLNADVWLSPLMILGTQWYLLFNVIAGASTVPTELRYAAQNLGLSGWLKWRRYLLPAIFPSVVTGAITATGGSWNASIVAEYVTWGHTTIKAHGIGSYIAEMTAIGDFPRIALGIGIMCIFVMGFNHFVWRRLYRMAENRLHF